MANSFISLEIHVIFSTKNRENLIDIELQRRLWPFLGGIAKQNNMVAYAIGGVENHVHILLSIPATITVSKAMQLIKAGSSKWIRDTYPEKASFTWQTGYSAYSVSKSNRDKVIHYINTQEEHHRIMTFEKEYIGYLNNSGLPYEEKYVWG
jgi:REP element-mobilizing transposase RayT